MLLVLNLPAHDTKFSEVVKSNKEKITEVLDRTDDKIQFILVGATVCGSLKYWCTEVDIFMTLQSVL
jgi:phosphatidylserine decarboxylase